MFENKIDEMVKRIANVINPLKIILFGSYARGTQNADSDVDLLVIEESFSSKHTEVLRIRKLVRDLHVPVDIIVATNTEFLERSKYPSNVYYWANKEGKLLHESA